MMRVTAAILLIMSHSAGAATSQDYGVERRLSTIQNSLIALRKNPKNTNEGVISYLRLVEQNQCRSGFESLTVKCLHDALSLNCAGTEGRHRENCKLISDLLMVNKLNEKQLISKDERVRLSRQGKGYAASLQAALQKKY